MSSVPIQEIKTLINEAVNSRAMDPEIRKLYDLIMSDHEFIKAWVKKEERKQEIWSKVKAQVIGWGIIAVLAAVGKAVYHFFFKGGV